MSAPELKIQLTAEGYEFFRVLQQAANALRNVALQAQGAGNGVLSAMQPAQASVSGLAGDAVKAASIFTLIRAAALQLKGTLDDLLKTNLRLEAAQRGLQFATGDGAAAMGWIRQISRELGLDLVVASEGFKLLAASTRETRLEGAPTRDIFRAVASAATVMGLDAEKTHGVLLALSQMVSKGRVQAEEMRKQLGEHLPGALNIAARAMGMSTAELNKMMETGQLLAEDFLPKFARQLQLELGDSVKEASDSTQANLNRLKAAWDSLLFALGQSGLMREAGRAAREFSDSMTTAVDNGGVQAFGQDLGKTVVMLKDGAVWLWEHRRGLMALASGYGVILAMRLAEFLAGWINGWRLKALAALQARDAVTLSALAEAGYAAQAGQSARAQVQAALADVARRKAALESAIALQLHTTADQAVQRQALLTTEAKLAEAAALASAGSAARGVGAATALLGGPIGWITALLMVGVSAWTMWGSAATSAGDTLLEAARKAGQSRERFTTLTADVVSLNQSLGDAKAKTDDKKRAQEQLNTVLKQMLMVYPDLVNYVRKEGEAYSLSLADLRKFTEEKRRAAQESVRQAEAAILAAQAEVKLLEARAAATRPDPRTGAGPGDYLRLDADRRRREVDKLQESLKEYLANLQKWQQQEERLTTPAKEFKALDTGKKAKENVFLQEQLRLREQGLKFADQETLAQKQQNELAKIDIDLAQEKLRLQKEAKEGRLTGPQLAQLVAQAEEQAGKARTAVERKYSLETEKLRADLLARLESQEEGGLAKRMKVIKSEFAQIRAKAKELGIDLGDAIDQAEAAAAGRARFDQVQQDLGKLKRELADLAQINGGALPLQQMEEAMKRFGAQSGTAAEAVAKLRAEMHLGEGGWAGMIAGVKSFVAQSQNHFEVWKNTMTSILGGLQNNFAQFFESIFQKGMTGAQKWDALWKGIVKTILGALSQMAAQWLVAAVANKLFGKSMAQTEAAKGIASQHAAAAGIFAAHAWIPFAGPGIAAGLIAMMNAVLGANLATAQGMSAKATAFAVGGKINKPTLALMGEVEPEIVAPERDFKDWAGSFAGIGASIAARQARTESYGLQASGYTAAAAAQARANLADGDGPTGRPDLRGATIFTSNSAEMARFLRSGLDTHGRLFG